MPAADPRRRPPRRRTGLAGLLRGRDPDLARRQPRYRRVEAGVLLAALAALTGLTLNQLLSAPDTSSAASFPDGTRPGRDIHVAAGAPRGGDGTQARPYPSIQRALVDAEPGDEILVAAGVYTGSLRSVRSGLPGKPIRLHGAAGAHITGGGIRATDHLIELTHDDLELTGFTISDANKLVWIVGAHRVRILRNTLEDAGGECVRIRYGASGNEIAGNTVRGCGQTGFDLDTGRKNGEGVYIGTAPEQLGRNPTREPDRSSGNRVADNRIQTPAECVDVKEAALGNLVERNTCTGGKDPDGGGFSSRGLWTVFRDNTATGNAGAGIRLGGDGEGDGVRSDVRGNRLEDNRGTGLLVQRNPQYVLCGNRIGGNGRGTTNADEDPTRACED
jgi:Right handed beta helix region